MSETIKGEIELDLICNECNGDLELALQKNRKLYIEPCKNCCKQAVEQDEF